MVAHDKNYDEISKEGLLQCEIGSVSPYALMLSPVYIFMKRNDKLVAVKSTLDFFVRDELERLRSYEYFYLTKPDSSLTQYQTAAKLIRILLQSSQSIRNPTPADYEVSREIMSIIGPLWKIDEVCRLLSTSVFSDELCEPINPELMAWAREEAISRHEIGIYVSGLTIFLLVHLGYYGLTELNRIRGVIYSAIVERDEHWEHPDCEWQIIARDVRKIIKTQEGLTSTNLSRVGSEWAAKIYGRIGKLDLTSNAQPSVDSHLSLSKLGFKK